MKHYHASCLLLACLALNAATAADIIAYADDAPPYHYLENGEATGLATELLLAGCRQAKLTCQVKIRPWARAYATVANTPDTILISIARRPDRESDFHWLSPIMTETVWAFGRLDSPKVYAVADLKNKRTGVIHGGSAEKFLRDAGIPDTAMDKASSIELNLLKLGARRVDFVIDTEARLAEEKAKFHIPFHTVKALRMHDITTWFVINHASQPKLVRALQNSLNANNANGVRDKIIQKYLGPGQNPKDG
ncbi:MAG: transporter substrate-binding domain-containing protein [Pseudomonadota bacterium]